jgi:hypothetical protein
MRDLLPACAVIASALLLVAAAVFGAGDRAMLVPPPDAVAESFVRELVTGRYDLATKYLESAVRRRLGADGLRRRYEPMRRSLGKIDQVEADMEFIDGERAGARARVEGDAGTAAMAMRFGREYGLWVVSDLPEPSMALRRGR